MECCSVWILLTCCLYLLCFCTVYHALYLEELTAAELIRKMACVCSLPLGTINQVYRQGPTGIHILLSDQVHTLKLFLSISTLKNVEYHSQLYRALYQEGCFNKKSKLWDTLKTWMDTYRHPASSAFEMHFVKLLSMPNCKWCKYNDII